MQFLPVDPRLDQGRSLWADRKVTEGGIPCMLSTFQQKVKGPLASVSVQKYGKQAGRKLLTAPESSTNASFVGAAAADFY